jgi:hypothetical protein
MFIGFIKMRIVCLISAIVIVLSMTGSVLAIDHWWHGGTSDDVNDPANWTDRNASTEPTTPTGDPRDIVRVGASWDSEDLNGNGVLDPGEDLNGNGIIDDPDPNSGIGYGGYYGSGAGIDVPVDPVLNTTYVSRTGGAKGGWWFVLNAPNILTLRDGAFLIMDQENCNLRNGGRLEVQGRSSTNGPSLITARRFRIAENGSIGAAAGETCQLRINGTGWVQMDSTLDGYGEAFIIGTSEPHGTVPRGEIIIEEQGRLELLSANPAPYLVFGNANPLVNQIIIRDKGKLWLPGNPATMGRVGPDDTVTSLQQMIDMGLITSDHGILTVSGASPTVVKVAKLRIASPSPADGQTNVATQAVLSWNPGTFAASHDVYFGADPDSVNDANRTNLLGVLKSQDQVETHYPSTGTLDLDFGQTYYWRIDEVNNLSDQPIYKGDLWSFTVESLAYPISGDCTMATASSNEEGKNPENTVNGSGLDSNDLHSIDVTNMWLSEVCEPGSAWIQYEFDKVYKLHEMLIWNYNGQSILTMFGLRDITIEYSSDGSDWTALTDVPEVVAATGMEDYAYNTTVAFEGAAAKFVKITANSNWSNGLFTQYGLSEVRFMHIPVGARQPEPDDGAADIAIDVTLGWRAGREAAEHNVYISDDEQSVIDGTAPLVTVSEASYDPLSLDLGSVYYWRVDEVNNANTVPVWKGDIWSFTTRDYLVVDDFEPYNDIPEGDEGSNLVYLTWIDGGYGEFNDPTNGSIIGYLEAFQSTMETTIVHGGGQSAPLMYDNRTASVSEVTASTSDLAVGSDWTIGTPATLSLWFYGDTDNPATGRMYVKVNGIEKAVDADFTAESWQEVNIDLASFGADLQHVTSLAISIQSGGSGMVFIDDIRLYAPLNN